MEQLDSVAKQINRNPFTVIGAILIVTAIMFTVLVTAPPAGDPSQSGFIPENEVVDAMTDIGEKFSTEYQVVTLIKSNDVISNATFVDMLELEIAFTNDEDISNSLTDQQIKSNSIVSLPNLLASQFNVSSDNLSELKTFYEGKSNQEIKSALQSAMDDPYTSAAITPLLGEFEENETTAKSTIITLILDNSNREGENSVQALERVAKVENVMGTISMDHRESKFDGTSAYSLGQGAMDAEINSQFEEDIGTRLMPFVLGFILLVLYLTFRSGIDMMLTLVSLFISIIWTFAFGVILDFEPSFFLTIIPILLIGLGVDYGIHLTMRYREGVVEDGDIDKANQISVVSVGSALLFATITTMIGFFSNLSSEITPIKEFGIQTGHVVHRRTLKIEKSIRSNFIR